jgi:hypothetical protein
MVDNPQIPLSPVVFPTPDNPVAPGPPTGTTGDIQRRVKFLIPKRWFSFVAPIRDAIIGGLSDCTANLFSFIGYAKLQTRLATATGPWLDVFCYDYLRRFLLRKGAIDDVFRKIIRATILQERVTRAGMTSAVSQLTRNRSRRNGLSGDTELRKKKPEHFVDERSLADIHASLERAAWVLEQKTAKSLQERSRQRYRAAM